MEDWLNPPPPKKLVGWENLLQEGDVEEEEAVDAVEAVEVVQKAPEEVAPSATKPLMYNMTEDTNGNMQIDKVSQGLRDAVPLFFAWSTEIILLLLFKN